MKEIATASGVMLIGTADEINKVTRCTNCGLVFMVNILVTANTI